MSEVTIMQMTGRSVSTPAVGAASSKGAAGQHTQDVPRNTVNVDSGKLLPAPEKNTVESGRDPAVASRQDLETALSSINEFVQSVQRDLRFSVDDELGKTIIKVIDSDSGDVIRQIPEDVVLELARKLKNDGGFQLVNTRS